MSELQVTELIDEMVEVLHGDASLSDWIAQRCDGSVSPDILSDSMSGVTEQLVAGESPQLPLWQRLFTAVAMQSAEKNGRTSFDACATAIDSLAELIEKGSLDSVAHSDVVTLGSTLTLLLAAQRKLHQRIEYAIGLLCERHAESISEMAERCEELWHRCGQMSGASSLFVWDRRREEWRLSQDFKPYRPEA